MHALLLPGRVMPLVLPWEPTGRGGEEEQGQQPPPRWSVCLSVVGGSVRQSLTACTSCPWSPSTRPEEEAARNRLSIHPSIHPTPLRCHKRRRVVVLSPPPIPLPLSFFGPRFQRLGFLPSDMCIFGRDGSCT